MFEHCEDASLLEMVGDTKHGVTKDAQTMAVTSRVTKCSNVPMAEPGADPLKPVCFRISSDSQKCLSLVPKLYGHLITAHCKKPQF